MGPGNFQEYFSPMEDGAARAETQQEMMRRLQAEAMKRQGTLGGQLQQMGGGGGGMGGGARPLPSAPVPGAGNSELQNWYLKLKFGRAQNNQRAIDEAMMNIQRLGGQAPE